MLWAMKTCRSSECVTRRWPYMPCEPKPLWDYGKSEVYRKRETQCSTADILTAQSIKLQLAVCEKLYTQSYSLTAKHQHITCMQSHFLNICHTVWKKLTAHVPAAILAALAKFPFSMQAISWVLSSTVFLLTNAGFPFPHFGRLKLLPESKMQWVLRPPWGIITKWPRRRWFDLSQESTLHSIWSGYCCTH